MTGPTPQANPALALGATLVLAGLVNGALAAARLVLPLIALALGASAAMVGLIAAMFTVAPMALNVRFGRWVDRAGAHTPFALAAGLVVLACVLFEIAPTVPMLPVVAALIGAGAIFGHVAASRAVAESGPRHQRTRNFGLLVVGYSLFQFVMPLAAGLALESLGARGALACLGAMGLAAILWLPTGLHGYAALPRAPAGPDPVPRARSLMRQGPLAARILVSSTFSAVQTIYPFVVSLLAVRTGLSAAQAATLLGAFALGTVVSRIGVGAVVRRVPVRVAMGAALLAGAALYALLPWLTGYAPLLILSGLIGLPVGLGVPISMTLIYDAVPEPRANEAMGLTMTVTNILQTALPLVMGAAAAGLGVSAMIWALSVLMLAATVVNRW